MVVKGEHSYTGSITSGIPQGSVLKPSLFMIHINDPSDGIKSRVCLFTDDTVLYSVIRTPTDSPKLRNTGVLGKEVAHVL